MKKENKNKLLTHWAVLCRSASVDKQSNNISLFNVLEELKVSKNIEAAIEKAPEKQINVPIDFTLVIQNEKEINDDKLLFSPEVRTQVIDPTLREILKQDIPLAFKLSEKRMRTIVAFPHMVITKPGKYVFVISTKASKESEFVETARTGIDVIFE